MQKITFENLPSTNTPLNASNLNTLQDNVETAINATISNTAGTSQTVGYSQEYINNNVGVVESGSNNNGKWIKYSDGTMICWQRQEFNNIQITNQQGVLYQSNAITPMDYPVSFVGEWPVVSRDIESSTWAIFGFGQGSSPGVSLTNPGSFTVFRGNSTGTGNVTLIVRTIAIGKWK